MMNHHRSDVLGFCTVRIGNGQGMDGVCPVRLRGDSLEECVVIGYPGYIKMRAVGGVPVVVAGAEN